MPRQKAVDRLEALKQKKAQIEAQLQAIEARQKDDARKADTRRKVIAGALALEHMGKNPESDFARLLSKLLDEYVSRPHDRALFDLPEHKTGQNASEPSENAAAE